MECPAAGAPLYFRRRILIEEQLRDLAIQKIPLKTCEQQVAQQLLLSHNKSHLRPLAAFTPLTSHKKERSYPRHSEARPKV